MGGERRMEERTRNKDERKFFKIGFKKLDSLFKNFKQNILEDLYFEEDFLEVIEVVDGTQQLEPQTIEHTKSSHRSDNYPRILKNIDRSEMERKEFADIDEVESKCFSIRKSSYFNKEQQIDRSKMLMNNLRRLTTVIDIPSTMINGDKNLYRSRVSFGSDIYEPAKNLEARNRVIQRGSKISMRMNSREIDNKAKSQRKLNHSPPHINSYKLEIGSQRLRQLKKSSISSLFH